jgi:hypothetical protein
MFMSIFLFVGAASTLKKIVDQRVKYLSDYPFFIHLILAVRDNIVLLN